jgi:hypothetical protein
VNEFEFTFPEATLFMIKNFPFSKCIPPASQEALKTQRIATTDVADNPAVHFFHALSIRNAKFMRFTLGIKYRGWRNCKKAMLLKVFSFNVSLKFPVSVTEF